MLDNALLQSFFYDNHKNKGNLFLKFGGKRSKATEMSLSVEIGLIYQKPGLQRQNVVEQMLSKPIAGKKGTSFSAISNRVAPKCYSAFLSILNSLMGKKTVYKLFNSKFCGFLMQSSMIMCNSFCIYISYNMVKKNIWVNVFHHTTCSPAICRFNDCKIEKKPFKVFSRPVDQVRLQYPRDLEQKTNTFPYLPIYYPNKFENKVNDYRKQKLFYRGRKLLINKVGFLSPVLCKNSQIQENMHIGCRQI